MTTTTANYKNNIVATYDYYTLEQAKKILESQRKRKIKRLKKAMLEKLVWMIGISFFTIIPVLCAIIYHVMFGY